MNNLIRRLNVSSCFRFKTCISFALIVCLSVLSGCSKDDKETYTLKLNLDKGDSFSVQMQSDETVKDNEGIQIMKQTTTLDAKFEVIEIDSDGVYSFRVIFDPIAMVADNQAGHFEFSSWQNQVPQNPDIRDLCAFYSILCKRALIVKVTPRGRIIRILGNERLYYELIDMLKPEPDTAENLKILASEDGIKNVIYYFFQILPEKQASKDEIWKDRQVFKMSFPMDLLMTTTLGEINDDQAELICRADIGIDTSSAYGPERFAGWQNRTVSVDMKTGMVKKSDIEFSYLEIITSPGAEQKIKTHGTVCIEVK